MQYEVSCRDVIQIEWGKGKEKIQEALNFKVEIKDGKKTIEFYQPGSYIAIKLVNFPVEYWATIKDTVDRLIIQAEKLAKDC